MSPSRTGPADGERCPVVEPRWSARSRAGALRTTMLFVRQRKPTERFYGIDDDASPTATARTIREHGLSIRSWVGALAYRQAPHR